MGRGGGEILVIDRSRSGEGVLELGQTEGGVGWEGERVGIDRSGVEGGESGDRQEWGGRGRVGIDRRSGRGREWG